MGPPILRYIWKYTTIVLSPTNTHQMRLNLYNIKGNDYFEENISAYKKEILYWLKSTVWRLTEDENPLTMTKELMFSKYGCTLSCLGYITYVGFKIGDFTFYGINEKNLPLIERVLNNNFQPNLKITLYADWINPKIFTRCLPIILHEDELTGVYSTDHYRLLWDLCIDEYIIYL